MVRHGCLILAAVAALLLAGCASTPAPRPGSEDPEVWRPTTPAVYPLPR